jgi:ribosomal protein S11
MWKISQRRRTFSASDDEGSRFGDWLSGGIEVRQRRLKGSDAAAGILVPIAAAAVGMTALALVLPLTTGR